MGNEAVGISGKGGKPAEFDRWSCQCESEKREEQDSHGEEQNVFQLVISPMRFDFLQDKHHGGKLDEFWFSLHEQVQHHWYGCCRHSDEK